MYSVKQLCYGLKQIFCKEYRLFLRKKKLSVSSEVKDDAEPFYVESLPGRIARQSEAGYAESFREDRRRRASA